MKVSPPFDIWACARNGGNEMTMQEKENTKNPAHPDLFEELRAALGCSYISDLRSPVYLKAAREAVAAMAVAEYPLTALSDMAEYLYAEKLCFESHEAARRFFIGRKNRRSR